MRRSSVMTKRSSVGQEQSDAQEVTLVCFDCGREWQAPDYEPCICTSTEVQEKSLIEELLR